MEDSPRHPWVWPGMAGMPHYTESAYMSRSQDRDTGQVANHNGAPTSIDELPPPNTKRWVIRRKAEVVAGVRSGLISLEEACERYTLSIEEFLSWQRLIDSHGVRGLRATRIQDYRLHSRSAD
jgi:hypothetical protein